LKCGVLSFYSIFLDVEPNRHGCNCKSSDLGVGFQ
jgi:hypothetical protein